VGNQNVMWTLQVHGQPGDISRIAPELTGGKIRAVVKGDVLHLTWPALRADASETVAEWAAYELLRLLEAAAYLYFGSRLTLRLGSVAFSDRLPAESLAGPSKASSTLVRIVEAAQTHRHLRSAVLAHAAGGARGLLKAYEAISYEIMDRGLPDYDSHIGTREWLVRQGGITDAEDRGFLDTVLHYRQSIDPRSSVSGVSPAQAERLVRTILLNVIG
jgi:hypothetical protein